MKKTYIEPNTEVVEVKCDRLLGDVSGDGLNMKINSTTTSGDADSRRSNNWDED